MDEREKGMIKIRVSYEQDNELLEIKQLLKLCDNNIKITSKPGKFKKAYITLQRGKEK